MSLLLVINVKLLYFIFRSGSTFMSTCLCYLLLMSNFCFIFKERFYFHVHMSLLLVINVKLLCFIFRSGSTFMSTCLCYLLLMLNFCVLFLGAVLLSCPHVSVTCY